MNLAKLVSIGIALLLIQGCSHPIEIVGEGDVTSQSGNRNCSLEQFAAADPVCSKNYVIGAYQETYNPSPRAGWKFDHWVTLCQSAAAPNYDCSFNVSATQVQSFWGKTMPPLRAIFTPISSEGIPIAYGNIVTVNFREWAQPVLFRNLSWNQINAVCPSGHCIDGGLLNGYDMTDWTWATADDVRLLFNSYGASPAIASTGCGASDNNRPQTWTNNMFNAGWRQTSNATLVTDRRLDGLVNAPVGTDDFGEYVTAATWDLGLEQPNGILFYGFATVCAKFYNTVDSGGPGAFFYR